MSEGHENFRIAIGSVCDRQERVQSPTNERYLTFYHEIYTAGDKDQFVSGLHNKSLVKTVVVPDTNLFAAKKVIRQWDKYKDLTSRSVTNTFDYLFNRFKKGIFVQVHENGMDTFLPFSNVAFRNDWWHLVKVDPKYGSIKEFLDYTSTLAGYTPSRMLQVDKWTANNALVRYEETNREYTNNLAVLYDMYATLCDEREVPDVEFFVNRKDYPLLTRDGSEPYNHLYGSKNVQMKKVYDSYCPIFSSASSERYADILVPTYEDWLRVLYQEKSQFIRYSCKKYPAIWPTAWSRKIKKAVFRGASTGAGFDAETNKRIKAFEIGKTSSLLDIGITKWNTRPRKYQTEKYMRTIELDSYPVANTLTPQEQSAYAYIVHIEGHSAAFRLSYELSFGSVLLIVESEWKLWFSKYLIAWVHYVPVQADLSDLVEKVQWCRDNDEQCQTIARNALDFYSQYLSYKAVLDYLQKTVSEVAEMVGKYSYVTDVLSTQLQCEKDSIDSITHSFRWLRINMAPVFQIPQIGKWRNADSLTASMLSFHGTTDKTRFIKQLFKSKKSVVNLVQVGILTLVEKTSFNAQSRSENVHESFIGLTSLNTLKLANFAYVYGPRSDESKSVVYTEYIKGINMADWLKSRDFSVDALLLILVQLNLALIVAQNRIGFVHNDLYPWNVILVKTTQPLEFHYNVKKDLMLKVRTDLIPVMIDFGKSRAVVYDRESKCIRDHGFVNLYKSNKILDTLTILISSLVAVSRRSLAEKYTSFFESVGLPPDTIDNLDHYKKYGQLFDLRSDDVDPLSFINFTVRFQKIPGLRTVPYSHEKSEGNPYALYFYTLYGDYRRALLDTIQRMLSVSVPNPLSAAEKKYTRTMVEMKTSWLSDEIYRINNNELTRKWRYVKRLLIGGRRNGSLVVETDFTLPVPVPKLTMDKSMSPQEIADISKNLTIVRGDLLSALNMYFELIHFDIEKEIVSKQYYAIPNRFDYLSDIAKNNTLLWLRTLV